MRQRFAPTHEICGRMRFVPPDDSAWRTELVETESNEICEEARKALPPIASKDERAAAEQAHYDSQTGHIFWRYFQGMTRFNLDDAELAPYLDRDKAPETWSFRRLTLPEREQVAYLQRSGRDGEAFSYAFARGVVRLENPGPGGEKLAELLQPGDRTEKQRTAILAAAEDYCASAVSQVGAACCRGSYDLTVPEKKA